MANQEHLDILHKQGVEVWNQWREEHPDIQPDLRVADLHGTNLRGANLSGADLYGTALRNVSLSFANLYGANLNHANLYATNLNHANLSGAILSEVNLNEASLYGADLNGADLHGVKLFEARLIEAKLNSADLTQADLNRANLIQADLIGANLTDADLTDANLRGADLRGADLDRTNLSYAILYATNFAKIDLRTAKGLTTIHHLGPSDIELFSVLLPRDGSALHFLHGVGVPDKWIDYWRASMMHPMQYHSCFISYSSKDELLASRLHSDLQAKGVRCWFAPEDMKIGSKFRQRIDEAIHLQDKLLLLLSEHSIASVWVENEVEAALEKEARQQREVLFPLRLDDAVTHTSQAWAATLRRTRHIGDFTTWTDPQSYQIAFDRLLHDLKQTDDGEQLS